MPETSSPHAVDTLIEIMAHEAGKTIAESDPEISEAIDFAHYYAERAKDLESDLGRRVHAVEGHRGHAAVELPGRDPRRVVCSRVWPRDLP